MGRSIIVYDISHLALGIDTSSRSAPMLPVDLVGGALADRCSRRTLVVASPEHLMNAVALSGSTWNRSRMVGPAVAGAAAAIAGPPSALFVEAAVYARGPA